VLLVLLLVLLVMMLLVLLVLLALPALLLLQPNKCALGDQVVRHSIAQPHILGGHSTLSSHQEVRRTW
jgi:hypothetical protein